MSVRKSECVSPRASRRGTATVLVGLGFTRERVDRGARRSGACVSEIREAIQADTGSRAAIKSNTDDAPEVV